ncbi:PLP-dependent aminotransferase family protein [Neobacillus niacini]|uniref:MocR-like pyridoxine biosynthesis transcription factor PdxR n=1 Tax=Neobacillus niacini TaxID=86668 RepID=UPI002FFDA24E
MDFTLKFDGQSKEPLYMQLYQHIKEEIQKGILDAGTRLPSIRQLSSYLNVSKNTIELAYQQLIAEGYVDSRARSGLYVVENNTDIIPIKKAQAKLFDEVLNEHKETFEYDFRQGRIDLEHFPYTTWRKLSNQVLFPENKSNFLYGDPQGELELRREIAQYLYQSRGVNCSLSQILVGSGIQQLLTTFCQIIGVNNQSIAIEEPSYDGARMVFKNLGFNLHPILLDETGINMEHLKISDANVVYVTPSHQFPCGMIMPYSKRMELIQWAEHRNGFIIEDDYDGEFRYIGKPIPSLQGLDPNGRVIYLGTFSKALLPALRMSYMVLPKYLLSVFKRNFASYEQTVSKIHQITMQLFMEEGHWERHIRKMRKIYQKKHATLISSIINIMDDKVNIVGSHSGLHILLQVNNKMTEKELVQTALRNKVKVYPTSIYFNDLRHINKPLIQLGFGGLTEHQITEGIILLNKAWFE